MRMEMETTMEMEAMIREPGTEGAVGLAHWFEKMKFMFHISTNIMECQVKYATCTLLGDALTWWNSHVRTVGHDATYEMPWKTLMKMITETYCPRKYSPKNLTNLEKYTSGLPNNIQGNVMLARPKMFQEAIELANDLMDQKNSGNKNENGNGNGDGDGSHDSGTGNRRPAHIARGCTYKDFLNYQPLNSKGTEGAVGLAHWFEKMKFMFHISTNIMECQVKYATCTLLGDALTWWNSHVRTVGHDATYEMPWKTLMKMITETYCPRKYSPKNLTNLEKYTSGLPNNIQGNVMLARPKMFQEAIELANDLMDQKVRAYAARQSDNKRRMDNNPRDNHDQHPPYKRQNVARAYTVGPGEKREYAGTLPLCKKCKFHHTGPCTVKCSNCKKFGHLTRDCRSPTIANNQRTLTCFECGNQGHYKSDCSKMKNQGCGNQSGNSKARGRVYALGGGLRVADSLTGNHPEDDFMPLETIRRSHNIIGKRIQFELEGETFEPERRERDWLTLSNRGGVDVPKALVKPITHLENWKGLKTSWKYSPKRPMIYHQGQGIDGEFNFLPEGGFDDNQGSLSVKSVNNKTPIIDAEPISTTHPSNVAENIVDSGNTSSEDGLLPVHPSTYSFPKASEKLKAAGKRKLTAAGLGEGSHHGARKVYVQANKVAGDASTPLDVDSDPDIHEFPSTKELKDGTDCHWVVVTPPKWIAAEYRSEGGTS
ncbi:putative reverse transcriptase domain-containing protein [Tanacetum coccineum]